MLTALCPELEKVLAGVESLRPLPASVLRLIKLAEDAETDLAAIVEIIAHDPSLTMEVLRVTNSAAYAGSGGASTVQESVAILGLSQIVSIAFCNALDTTLSHALPEYELRHRQLFRHSVLSSVAAEHIAYQARAEVPAEVVPAALMHDIGKVIICQHAPQRWRQSFLEAQKEGGLTRLAAENEIFSVNHAELGCLLAQRWRIPEPICHAIQYHHQPDSARGPLCDVVHLANTMAKKADAADDSKQEDLDWTADVVLRLGLSLDQLEAMVERVQHRFEEIRSLYSL